MKAFNCLDIGNAFGVITTEDAYWTVSDHATSIFPYKEIDRELYDLLEDFCKYGFAEKIARIDGGMGIRLKENYSIEDALKAINERDGTELKFSE